MTPTPILVTAGLVGSVAASFVTTLAMRISLAGAPAGERSACDGCRRQLGWLETTPIVSFVALRGRCRTCAHPISPLHPLGEAIGLVVGVAIVTIAPNLRGAAMAIMAMALLATSIGDALTARLNNLMALVVLLCALFLALNQGPYDLLVGLACALFWLGVLTGAALLFRLQYKRTGLGRGDIRLCVALSVWLGVASCWMIAIAPLLPAIVMAVTGRLRKSTPMGPVFAACGFTIGLLLEAGLWPRL